LGRAKEVLRVGKVKKAGAGDTYWDPKIPRE